MRQTLLKKPPQDYDLTLILGKTKIKYKLFWVFLIFQSETTNILRYTSLTPNLLYWAALNRTLTQTILFQRTTYGIG